MCSILNMGDAAWKRLNAKVNAKRAKKATTTTTTTTTKTHPKPKELTIQRLSAEVVGKAQKYTRIGPQEFVALKGQWQYIFLFSISIKHTYGILNYVFSLVYGV
jgi:hypothetical protein